MTDRFVFTVQYDKALMKAVARRYIMLGHSYSNPVNTPLAFVLFVVFQTGLNWAVRYLQLNLGLSFLAVLLIVVLAAAGLFWLHWNSVFRKLRPLVGQSAVFRLADLGLAFEANGRTTNFSWYDFEGIRQAERFWLLIRVPGEFLTLPLVGLSGEIRAFLALKTERARDGKLLTSAPA